MGRVVLLDADVIAFQCSSRLEEAVEWEPGFWTWNVSFDAVCNAFDGAIEEIKEKLEADHVRLCLTDPKANFRLDVLPTYKTHRSTMRKPLVLYHLKEWLVENRGGIMVPGLEGDDVLGILATRPSKHEQIVMSLDKDLRTIPCDYVRGRALIGEDGTELLGQWEILTITEEEADRFHMIQSLAGDVTDGYGGCPGFGMGTAAKVVDERIIKVPYEHTFKSGPRKGQTETRYQNGTADTVWEAVVAAYENAGLSEEVALQMARCARILRNEDYDMDKKEVKLWTPTTTAT